VLSGFFVYPFGKPGKTIIDRSGLSRYREAAFCEPYGPRIKEEYREKIPTHRQGIDPRLSHPVHRPGQPTCAIYECAEQLCTDEPIRRMK